MKTLNEFKDVLAYYGYNLSTGTFYYLDLDDYLIRIPLDNPEEEIVFALSGESGYEVPYELKDLDYSKMYVYNVSIPVPFLFCNDEDVDDCVIILSDDSSEGYGLNAIDKALDTYKNPLNRLQFALRKYTSELKYFNDVIVPILEELGFKLHFNSILNQFIGDKDLQTSYRYDAGEGNEEYLHFVFDSFTLKSKIFFRNYYVGGGDLSEIDLDSFRESIKIETYDFECLCK